MESLVTEVEIIKVRWASQEPEPYIHYEVLMADGSWEPCSKYNIETWLHQGKAIHMNPKGVL